MPSRWPTVAVTTLALTMLVAALPARAAAQEFAGTWVNDDPTNTTQIRLVLAAAQNGRFIGTLSGAGTTVPIDATVRDDVLVARIPWKNAEVVFEAEVGPEGLDVIIAAPRADGSANYDEALDIAFVRERAAPPAAAGAGAGAATVGPGGGAGGQSAQSPLAREWDGALRGRKLTQLDSYGGSDGGYGRRRELHLCSSGQFQYSERSSVNADVGGVFGGGSGGDGGTGQWQILSEGDLVGIDLRFGDGRHWQVRLAHQNGQVYIDGVRTYVTAGEICP